MPRCRITGSQNICGFRMTDRRTRYEARRRESGWRHITVRLDSTTLAVLERLAERCGDDRSAAVRAAILAAASREQG